MRFFYQSSGTSIASAVCGNAMNDADDSTGTTFSHTNGLEVDLFYDDSVALPFYRAIRVCAQLQCVAPNLDVTWTFGLSWGQSSSQGSPDPSSLLLSVSGFSTQTILPDDTFSTVSGGTGLITTLATTTTTVLYDRILGFAPGFDMPNYTNTDKTVELIALMSIYSGGAGNVVPFSIKVFEFRLLGSDFSSVDCGVAWGGQPPRRQQIMIA